MMKSNVYYSVVMAHDGAIDVVSYYQTKLLEEQRAAIAQNKGWYRTFRSKAAALEYAARIRDSLEAVL